MSRIGIVGSEAAKFTPVSEATARKKIRLLIAHSWTGVPPIIVSGKCHLGGIDIWAIEEATALGCPTVEYPPKTRRWSDGYMPRNKLIAEQTDRVVCFTVRTLPPGYTGMTFKLCYHCRTNAHVKSGGCWTVKYARSLGKPGEVIVIDQE